MKNKILITTITLVGIGYFATRSNHLEVNSPIKSREQVSKRIEVMDSSNAKKLAPKGLSKKIENIISKKSEILTENIELRKKAILSKEEKLKLDNYFTNSKNIRVAYLTLRSKDFSNLDKSINKRIEATNFLVEGIKRKSVNRSELIKATEMFLLSETEEQTNDLEIRRAIIGDKIELFHALSEFAPEQAKKFKENYMSERLKKVIKYVEINMKRMRGNNES
jgi:translation elongation factor EF-Ts